MDSQNLEGLLWLSGALYIQSTVFGPPLLLSDKRFSFTSWVATQNSQPHLSPTLQLQMAENRAVVSCPLLDAAQLAELKEAGDCGSVELAKALKLNQSLTKLNLYFCRIGSAGVTALAQALEVNRSLVELALDGNDFCDQLLWSHPAWQPLSSFLDAGVFQLLSP